MVIKFPAFAAVLLLAIGTAQADDFGVLDYDHTHRQLIDLEPPVVTARAMANLSDQMVLDTRGLKAFPGAEGWGQDSVGGRGGQLLTVNTTDCNTTVDGQMSFTEAFNRSGDAAGVGAATIVFSVGGLMDCGVTSGGVSTFNAVSFTTVACQSAPAPGFNIAAWRIEYKGVNNIVVRGCRFMNQDNDQWAKGVGQSASVIRVVGSGNSNDIIFDRLDILHNVDDVILGYYNDNMTVGNQLRGLSFTHSMILESDGYSSHEESNPNGMYQGEMTTNGSANYRHAHGVGCSSAATNGTPVIECSIIGSVIAHTARRNPRLKKSSGELINNFSYNVQQTGLGVINLSYAKGGAYSIDVHVYDNQMKWGPNTKLDSELEQEGFRISASGSRDRIITANNSRMFLDGTILAFPERTDAVQTPIKTFHASQDWYAGLDDLSAFDCKGAYYRDANVVRILNEIKDGTGEVGIGTFGDPTVADDGDAGKYYVNDPNYYPASTHPVGYDTDNDGMPDAWETANGLNVGVADHNADLDSDGYTNIEEFLSYQMRCS